MAELADAQDLGSCGETRGGSTPLSRTLLFSELRVGMDLLWWSCCSTDASVAQSGRASRCQRECRGFKSLRSLHFFFTDPND